MVWLASERLQGHRSEPEGGYRDALARLTQPPGRGRLLEMAQERIIAVAGTTLRFMTPSTA